MIRSCEKVPGYVAGVDLVVGSFSNVGFMQRLVKGVTTATGFADVEVVGRYLALIAWLHAVVQAHGAVFDFRELRKAITIGIIGRSVALKAINGQSLLAVF